MTKEEIIEAIQDDKMMPFIQPAQLAEIVNFVIKNYKPSLPSNLDEAAHHSAVMVLNNPAFLPNTPFSEILKILDGLFKSGAEWMAGQGESHETEIVSRVTGNGLLPAVTCLANKSYNEGDKVVVQIRKK